jgi:sugar phosphate isomerase/epimerase
MKPEQLAVSMWSLHRQYYEHGWTVFDFLEFAQESGVCSVELLNNFWRNESEELPKVVTMLNSTGLKVAAWAVNNDFALDDYDGQIAELLHGIDVARRLKTPTVRVFAAHPRPGIDLEATLATAIRGLKAVAPVAEGAHITLAIENHGLLAGKTAQIRHLIDAVASPALRANADIGNFLLVGEDPLQAVNTLLPHIAHIHVKDMIPVSEGGFGSLSGQHYRGGAIGEGVVPVGPVLKRLNEAGYHGYLSLEFEGEGDERDGVRRSLDALRVLLPQ